jgi:hypothetical protein
MTKKTAGGVDRRNFLKTIGSGAAGTAAVVAAAGGAPNVAVAAENAADRKKKRYRESDHVKSYYATNRY